MTQKTADRVASLGRSKRAAGRVTMAGALAGALLATAAAAHQITWPSPRYRQNPAAFFHEVLGVEPWTKQREVIEAVRDHKFVSVRAGQKVSKSNTDAGVALWFFASFDDARVVMTSTTQRQVDAILWRELRKMHARAGRCEACRSRDRFGMSRCDACKDVRLLDGVLHDLARSGLKAPDFREVVGFTAKEAEAVAGVSGANLLYIGDEASGIADEVIEAMLGNLAGGGRILLTGNPTRTTGYFYQTHTTRKEHWKTVHISSEDSPNVLQGRDVIPGLATRDWVLRMREEWGEDSALYKIRVRGEFADEDDAKVIPVHLIEEAEERWRDPEVEGEGRLHVGIDVARFGDDDSAAAPRRGHRAIELVTWHGLDEKALAAAVMQVVRKHRQPREPRAAVKVDACGGIGIRVVSYLLKYSDEIEVIPVNVAERSRLPREFPLLRDQLWFGLRSWLKEGGAIPADPKLDAELSEPKFAFDERGRRRVESKDTLRKRLKRSPDRADALALSVWEPSQFRSLEHADEFEAGADDERAAASDKIDLYGGSGIDPYGGSGIDPYGGGRRI